MQTTSSVLMVKPINFGFNEETAESNAFQTRITQNVSIHDKALAEFEAFVNTLRSNGVEVLVVEDTASPAKPDSIFPNNWFSSHDDGKLFLYPMHAPNRRQERRPEIIEAIKTEFRVGEVVDFSGFEQKNKFLEGTGSMVLDRVNKVAYACLSPRTDLDVLAKFAEKTGYKIVSFHSTDQKNSPIYHTNVMMSIGRSFSVICLDTIKDKEEKDRVVESLIGSGKEIVPISYEQLTHFAGNMLELQNEKGESLLVMSQQAFNSLSESQKTLLSIYSKLVFSPLDTIESIGGGSARCMIAELHLKHK